ncbi:thiol-disulfide oxidoreductase DCC family protein [Marinibactrum halimedae]|uniref:Redox protein n=1 Tax=Marinibactrum halimedae TaxID=1444977 RepID=A0AA37T441_9GAMM|nr:DUF393 domain-containing protein [Marinibactrum halimedae]MCD9459150.1 DUF393 domain-containing protein [Marinibactrum halimedae]GLS24752.1 redox protein [Marinibactrum halimedae]
MPLILFYDSQCPLCVIEMDSLKRKDHKNDINLVDIHSEQFTLDYPAINKASALAKLHAMDESGKILLGLDVTHAAWSRVGRGWLTAPLRWPLIRVLADAMYNLFAVHRFTLSKWLTGKARCQPCQKGFCCPTPPPQEDMKTRK